MSNDAKPSGTVDGNAAAPKAAPAALPLDEQSFFQLWLLLTSNSAFLLDQVSVTPAAGGTSPSVRLIVPAGETLNPNVQQAASVLQPADGSLPQFSHDGIANLLKNLNTDTLPDVGPFAFKGGQTHAAVLANAASVFQIISPGNVDGYRPPCPATMGPILDLNS